MREALVWFSQQMEAKLKENDHKGGWQTTPIPALYQRAEEEMAELKTALLDAAAPIDQFYDNIIREAADVANFMMFISDKVREMKEMRNAGLF